MADRYERARAAYEAEVATVQAETGCRHEPQPWDLTGAFVMDDHAWRLLKRPTRAVAAQIYEDLLDHGDTAGWDVDGRPHNRDGDDDVE